MSEKLLPIIDAADLRVEQRPSGPQRIARGRVPPFIVYRSGKCLVVDGETGYWAVGDASEKEMLLRGISLYDAPTPNPTLYDTDSYPLECTLYLTNKCNLSCSYCYSTKNREENWINFSSGDVRKVIRLLMSESRRNALNFFLFGGEALTAIDVLTEVVEYAKELNQEARKTLTFRLQTNATLIDASTAAYLARERVSVGVSLDGPKPINDRARVTHGGKGTFDETIRGIELLKEAGVNVGVLATVWNPAEMLDVFKFFAQSELSQFVKISPALPEGAAQQSFGDISRYAEEWGKANIQCAKWLIRHNLNADMPIRESNLFTMVTHLLKTERPDICLRTPCAAGFGMLEFHPDGSIVTCDKTLYTPELGVVSNLCDLPEGASVLELLEHSSLVSRIRSRTVDTIPKCSHCPVKRHCGGSCTLGSYDLFGSFYREDVMCHYRRFMFEELMWLMAEDPLNSLLLACPQKIPRGISGRSDV